VTNHNATTYKARHNRPAWLGYVLVAACVVVVQLVLFLIRGTALYDSFTGFPGFLIGLLLSMIVAATVGALIGIPVLRLRGDYLAIVTLGFGEIVRLMFNNLRTLTGGPQGVATIPRISFGPLEMGSSEGMLYVALAGCLIMAFVALRLKSSRVGRAWGAVRSDEDIAQAVGVNPFNMKVFAYGLAASLAGAAGVLFASRQLSIYPENFNLLVSINVLSLVIIGGMGSIPGVIVGALVLIGVPEALRAFETYRILVFGALLVAMMVLRPQGMLPEPPFPLAKRAKELWQAEKGRAQS
jgi:branched-chain amino acid transport system permease protein